MPAKPMVLFGLNGQEVQRPFSPTVGSPYGHQYTWVLENPVDGADVGRALSYQGAFTDATMDGIEEILGGDFADFVDPAFPQNNISTDERLESMGVDPGTGRNILRLTVEFFTDASLATSGAQWDSFDMDKALAFKTLDISGGAGHKRRRWT